MTKLTQRGPNAAPPARLPGIQTARIDDANVRQAVEALREWVEVRLGSRGDIWERAITKREYKLDYDELNHQIKLLERRLLEIVDKVGTTGTAGSQSTSQIEFDAFKAYVQTELDALRSGGSTATSDIPFIIRLFAGQSQGAATASAVGATLIASAGSSAGAATVSAQALALGIGTGSSSGVATVSGVGPGDPNFSSVLLLMHYEGTSGTATFTDSSSYAHTTVAQNGAVISNAQAKFGSCAFQAGAGASRHTYVSSSANSTWQMTGDFTFEQFIYPLSTPSQGTGSSNIQMLFHNRQNSDATRVFLGYANWTGVTSGPGLWFQIDSGGSGLTLIHNTTLTLNTWHHVAVTRQDVSGTKTFYLLLNGSVVASTTSSITYPVPQNDHVIGRGWDGNFPADMWIDEVRITKGVARYTGSYTVPTAPFPDF